MKSLLAGYVGVSDTWGAAFTPELLELYPKAIVICTVREPAAWFNSWTNISGIVPPFMKLLLWPVPTFRYMPYALEELFKR